MSVSQPTAAGLADALTRFTVARIEDLVAAQMPAFRVPAALAGHRVGPDVRADLVFTLGMLHDLGVEHVAGVPVPDAIRTVLRPIDGPGTHTFFSYRVAETLARFGAFEGNPLLEGLAESERLAVDQATDSGNWLVILDKGLLPRNYNAVLARCLWGRRRLGLEIDEARLDALLEGTRAILGENPLGALDDSNTRIARYDIYTADFALFTEPLAEALGPVWARGLESALSLVRRTLAPNGAAIPWGRSTGVLATCLTLELAGLAVARAATGAGESTDSADWLARAKLAYDDLEGWFEGGIIQAHAHRSPYAYRGPKRRLQMTLDVLGKLTDAALHLRHDASGDEASPRSMIFPPRDELVPLGERDGAHLWVHRSDQLAFLLPLVGATVTDYLPAPRAPGLFEVPVDSALASFVPVAWRGEKPFTSGMPPSSLEHGEARLEAAWDRFVPAGLFEWPEDAEVLEGRRRVRFRVTGRRLEAEEELEFPEDALPDAVTLQIPEAKGRPLAVAFEAEAEHATSCVPTEGLAENRSFWSELPRVHQLDLAPAPRLRFRWSVSPKLRVATTAHGEPYNRSLYDAIGDRVEESAFPFVHGRDLEKLPERLRDVDIVHVHWPEWTAPMRPALHRELLDRIHDAGVAVLWTQHNATPHRHEEHSQEIYEIWTAEVDGIIHHSEWGRAEMHRRYRYRGDVVERVIPHGHWGRLADETRATSREEAEAALGLAPCELRIGVVGAPRPGKETQQLMEAFAACDRPDMQLLVTCLAPDDRVPDDPRIHAFAYEHVARSLFNQRMAAMDLLAIPIREGHQLTTGVVADALATGLPALISEWPFLREVMGDAGIVYRDGELESLLQGLDRETVERAAAACRERRPRYAWSALAEPTLELLDALGTRKI